MDLDTNFLKTNLLHKFEDLVNDGIFQYEIIPEHFIGTKICTYFCAYVYLVYLYTVKVVNDPGLGSLKETEDFMSISLQDQILDDVYQILIKGSDDCKPKDLITNLWLELAYIHATIFPQKVKDIRKKENYLKSLVSGNFL